MTILMVQHTYWSRHYGGSRVQVELAEELRAQGHTVDKYSLDDCFAESRVYQKAPRWFSNVRTFAPRARRFIRERADRYDVIDALHGTLPFSKSDLRFSGLMVCRSVGLQDLYERQLAKLPARGGKRPGHPVANLLRDWIERRDQPLYPASLRHADVVNVCNADELAYLRPRLHEAQAAVQLPFGLTIDRLKACGEVARDARRRHGCQMVVFIGLWIPRKGSLEIGDIIRRVLAGRPGTRFRLLGLGGFRPEDVWSDLGDVPQDLVEIVPSYQSSELPSLLRDATVGMFPSHAEGFPFAVLEKLACGVPTVAYDVPGPRETLPKLGSEWLVPQGDRDALSDQLISALGCQPAVYQRLAARCTEIASEYRWEGVAAQTTSAYAHCLEAMRPLQR